RATARDQRGLLVALAVGPDRRPTRAAVRRLAHHVPAEVHDARVGRGHRDGRRPVEAMLQLRRFHLGHAGEVRPNGTVQPGLQVHAGDVAVLRVHVQDRRIARRRNRILAVPAGHREPLRAVQPTPAPTPPAPPPPPPPTPPPGRPPRVFFLAPPPHPGQVHRATTTPNT